MQISIDEIAKIFSKIIDLYKAHGIEALNFNTDFYFKFLPEDWGKVTNESVLPAIGSLEDDITSIKKSLEDDFFTSLDIERVSAILYGSMLILDPQESFPFINSPD